MCPKAGTRHATSVLFPARGPDRAGEPLRGTWPGPGCPHLPQAAELHRGKSVSALQVGATTERRCSSAAMNHGSVAATGVASPRIDVNRSIPASSKRGCTIRPHWTRLIKRNCIRTQTCLTRGLSKRTQTHLTRGFERAQTYLTRGFWTYTDAPRQRI